MSKGSVLAVDKRPATLGARYIKRENEEPSH